MKRKGEKRVGQSRPKIKKTTYFVLAMICLTIICISPIFIGKWLIQRQAEATVQNNSYASTGTDCGCPFSHGHGEVIDEETQTKASVLYNGAVQHPSLDAAYGDVSEFNFIWLEVEYHIDFLNLDGSKTTGSEVSPLDGINIDGNIAGTHYYKIEDPVTGQVICERHAFTIAPTTLAADSGTVDFLYTDELKFIGDNVSYQATWEGAEHEEMEIKSTIQEAPLEGDFASTEMTASVSFTPSEISIATALSGTQTVKNIIRNNYSNADGANAVKASGEGTYTALATCYSYCESATENKTWFYGTLNQALRSTQEATSATTVVAMQSFTYDNQEYTAHLTGTRANTSYIHRINQADLVVGTNVTLSIPYTGSGTTFQAQEDNTHMGTDRYACANDSVNANHRLDPVSYTPAAKSLNKVILSTSLTNNGTIILCGRTGFAYPRSKMGTVATPQGATTGYHTTLEMESNAHIYMSVANASLEVFGYITDATNATVEVSNGTVKMPLAIYDYHGGGFTIGNFKAGGISPFTTFDMPNIQCTLICEVDSSAGTGARIQGFTSLYTTGATATVSMIEVMIPAKYNIADFGIFGTSDALFNMSNGTATFKYTSDNTYSTAYSTGYLPARSSVTDIQLNGDTESGDLAMTIVIATYDDLIAAGTSTLVSTIINILDLEQDVSLATVKFPVSDKIHLTLSGDYDYEFSTDFKFLPGAKLEIKENATVTATGGLLFYQGVTDAARLRSTAFSYYNTEKVGTAAECNVYNATLIINGPLGGLITPKHSSATLKINSTTLTFSEPEGNGAASGSSMLSGGTFTKIGTEEGEATGIIATSNSTYDATKGNLPNFYYTALDILNTDYPVAWFKPMATITLNANGGSFQDGQNSKPTVAVNKSGMTDTSVIANFDKPTRGGYSWAGWATTQNATTASSDSVIGSTVIYDGTILYAVWEEAATSFKVTYIGGSYDVTITPNEGTLDAPAFTTPTETVKSNDTGFAQYVTSWEVTELKVNNTAVTITNKVYSQGASLNILTILTEVGYTGDTSTITDIQVTMTAQWGNKAHFTVASPANGTLSVSYSGTTFAEGKSFYAKKDDTFTVTATPDNDYELDTKISVGSSASNKDSAYIHTVVDADVNNTSTNSISCSFKESCIAAGTLITLADGTQKKVEDLTMDDVLLVFNHETGEYEAAGIIFIENDGYDYYNVINLTFSNGTTTKIIYEHALFDLTLNKYVYITEENCTDFVGHEFALQSGDTFERVTLTDAYVAEEYTGCYSLVTVYHLNYFIDGLFSIPGGITGLFNIFEYGDDLVYDQEKMQADIEKYGLYTYEDFAEIVPEEIYNAFPAAYFKVSIGKGLMTWDDILKYIEQFIVKNGLM